MPRYTQTFTVTGRTAFPVDMLRRDYCHPIDVEAVDTITRTLQGDRPAANQPAFEARLARTIDGRHAYPTNDRWSSFGWSVVPGSVVTEKY